MQQSRNKAATKPRRHPKTPQRYDLSANEVVDQMYSNKGNFLNMVNIKFNITIIQPLGYAPALDYLGAAESVLHSLLRAGHKASFRKNRIVHSMINIIFGAHLPLSEPLLLPAGSVIFNTENLNSASRQVTDAYRELLEKNYVWDYSEANLSRINHDRKAVFPFTFIPEMVRSSSSISKDIDLIIEGGESSRKKEIIQSLISKGLRVREITNLFGAPKEKAISQAHAVLVLNTDEHPALNQLKCFYPLNQGVAIISDNFISETAPPFYTDCVLTPGDAPFEEFIVSRLNDERTFHKRIKAFQSSEDDENLGRIINTTIADLAPLLLEGEKGFTRINLGSGKDYRPGWLNIDVIERVHPDLVLDLSQEQDFPIRIQSDCLGEIVLEKGSIELIMANDVLEHVPDLPGLMKTCLDLLCDGGIFSILVPYDLSFGAWQDPTHIRGFNQNSWLYYTDWAWYLGWQDARFDLTHLEYRLSSLGVGMQKQGISLDVILKTPRAVDAMQVKLVKRRMTIQESTLVQTYAQDWLTDATLVHR